MNSAVTRAVLLAAGRGARLGPLTEHFPKPMLEVGGQPILHRIIAGLAVAGIEDLSVVTGHMAGALESGTGDGSRWGLRIRYFRQPEPTGTAAAIELAREALAGAPFFAGWGDIVVDPANYRRVIEAARGFEAALAVNEVDDPSTGGAVYVDAGMNILRMVEKPAAGTSATNWNNAGLMVLPEAIWRYVDALAPSVRGELELPQAIAAAIGDGMAATAVPIEGLWFDVGTPESLSAARNYFRTGD